ncbi:MAG TPA: hypothetical protein VKY22_20770 [Bradyrhizobium sp.]|nr:hypothetical protein [Bradyrhizobium sp.]
MISFAGERMPIRRSHAKAGDATPSTTYRLIAKAVAERKQVLCVDEGFARAVCPVVLGHKHGREQA